MRLRAAAFAAVVLMGAVGLSNAPASGADDQDATQGGAKERVSEYEYSVVDEVLPSKIEEGAKALVGDRFVDIEISENQQNYVIGVLEASPDEAEKFSALLSSEVPVTVETRTVSRPETEALYGEVWAGLKSTKPGTALIVGRDYATGTITIIANGTDALDAIDEVASAALPGSEQKATQDGATVFISSEGSDSTSISVQVGSMTELEADDEAPYRAGKLLAVGAGNNNCTTGWFMHKNGNNFGLTAGHCGQNNSNVYFAADQKGDVQNNQLWANDPAHVDASLFALGGGGTKTLYRSSTLNRDVTGEYANDDLDGGFRICVRGAFTGDQSCGDIKGAYTDVPTWSSIANRYVNNSWCWDTESPGITNGDSGGPVYRVRPNESVWAAGLIRSGISTDTDPTYEIGCFNPIATAENFLNATLAKQ